MLEHPYCGIPTFFGSPLVEGIKDLDIALGGVPFDLGASIRSGARQGSREIRSQSRLVGFYDHHSGTTPFADQRIADVGDVPFHNPYNIQEALSDIESFYSHLALAEVLPITAGGDHSITFPILRGLVKKEKVGLIHFDSHCDTAPSLFECGLEHACPMRNAVEAGLVDPRRTVQIGIRGTAEVLWQYSYDSGMRVIHIDEFYDLGWRNVLSEIKDRVGDGPVYVSFDIDCLDPAFAPGTGTPVAGGMTTFEALRVLRGLRGLNIIGGDLVEVSPPFDMAGITALAGATLMFEILFLAAKSRALNAK